MGTNKVENLDDSEPKGNDSELKGKFHYMLKHAGSSVVQDTFEEGTNEEGANIEEAKDFELL